MSDDRLAIDGGTPVRPTLLPYARQTVDASDERAVLDALRSDYLTTGPRVEAFEEAFAAQVGARHAVAFSNGTAALHAAAHVSGLGPGTDGVTTPLTFVATANCVRYVGATPVFADIRDDTMTLDMSAAETALTPRTRALLPVDYAGAPADLDEALALASRASLVVIEDASHSLGATYRGRRVGSIAHLTTFSLHAVKHITTGEGGVVTTGEPDLAERLRRFRNHGIDADARARAAQGSWFYDVVETGMNYRLSDIQCALGLSQLGRLAAMLARRRELAAAYAKRLAALAEVETPVVPPDRESAWHLYPIRLRLERLKADRGRIFAALRAENIGVNVHYVPVHLHSAYEGPGARGRFPRAESAYDRLVTLPLWPGMTDADLNDVVRAVERVMAAFQREA
jgi:perosamine synthetase